jgi:coproporphyrinogen III oxidase-like Fe-S oxidoreductase
VGLGASGYIGETRYKNTVNLSQYLNRVFINEKENVSIRDKFVYQVMLNLRTIEGLDIEYLKDKETVVEDLINKGLLIKRGNKVITTYEGMMILDQIVLQLI